MKCALTPQLVFHLPPPPWLNSPLLTCVPVFAGLCSCVHLHTPGRSVFICIPRSVLKWNPPKCVRIRGSTLPTFACGPQVWGLGGYGGWEGQNFSTLAVRSPFL